MPAEQSVGEQTKAFFGNLLTKKKSKEQGLASHSKDDTSKTVEILERSLPKDDPLLQSNTFTGDEADQRKNNKNKRREEELNGLKKENIKDSKSTEVHLRAAGSEHTSYRRKHKMVTWPNKIDSCVSYDGFMSKSKSSHSDSFVAVNQLRLKPILKGALSPSKYEAANRLNAKYDNILVPGTADISNNNSHEHFSSTSLPVVDKKLKKNFRKTDKSTGALSKPLSFSGEDIPSNYDNSLNVKMRQSCAISEENLVASGKLHSTKFMDDTANRTLKIEDLSGSSETFQNIDTDLVQKSQHEDSDSHFIESEVLMKSIDEDKNVKEKPKELDIITEPPPSQVRKRKWKGFKLPWSKDEKTPSIQSNDQQMEIMRQQDVTDANNGEVVEEETPFVDELPSTSREPNEQSDSQHLIHNQDSTHLEPTTPPLELRGLPPPIFPVVTNEEIGIVNDESTRVKTARQRRKKGSRRPKPDLKLPESEPIQEDSLPVPTTPIVVEGEPVFPTVSTPSDLDDGKVLSVTVHHSDHLRADLKYMAHPLVRVSIVDGSTGSYLQKTMRSRRVTSYYESDDITSVLPIMTQPFDFRANQSVLPRWEEMLIFNESFQSMVTPKNLHIPSTSQPDATSVELNVKAPSPVLFFVVRDFVSMAKANNKRHGHDDMNQGWHTIAWAFLKLVGANEKPNIGHRIRLQLYYPPRDMVIAYAEAAPQYEPAFFWWRDHARHSYPSTLYVTLKAVNRPDEMDPASRSMFATQPECGMKSYKQLHSSLKFADRSKEAGRKEEKPKWSRLPGQTCKIPNVVSLRLWSGSDGAFTIKFSNSGTRLAIACKHGSGFPILMYGIPSGEEMGALSGHQQLVYDINWSNDDRKMVTASGDGTAQVWNLDDTSKASHTLPHPAYVYTAAFHPTAQYIVATGGYDSVLRVWSIATTTAQMLQELDGHRSFINSLVFDFSGLNLYSADSSGLIIAWNCHSHERPKKNNKTTWSLKSRYDERELKGVCINSIEVHPGNNKLLLHCRDSTIRMLDVRIHTLLHYSGSVNHRRLIRCDLTPCGSFVISGSEDGCAYVWNAESGDQVAIYNELGFSRTVRDVSFHPHEHLVAFCCFHPNMPVLVFKYSKEATAITGGVISVVGTTAASKKENETNKMDVHRVVQSFASTLKVERVKQQLDTVLPEPELSQQDEWFIAHKMVPFSMAVKAFSEGKKAERSPQGSPRPRSVSPTNRDRFLSPQRYDRYGSYGPNNSTWGSTFDTTIQESVVEPSYLSPHASPEMRLMAQHLAANQRKPDNNNQGWRPTFTAVGGSPYRSDLNSSLGPDVSLSVDESGNKILQITSTPGSKSQHNVVALYDYQANRSDELTMFRGDVIKVLYKDSATWWFGERVSDNKQGYFPTNYVDVQGEGVDEAVEAEDSQEILFGVPSDRPDSAESIKNRMVHALKMPSGKVQFYSQSESEGDDDKLASLSVGSRHRRRTQRAGTNSSMRSLSSPNSRDSVASSSKPPRQASPRMKGGSTAFRALPIPSPRSVIPKHSDDKNKSFKESDTTVIEAEPKTETAKQSRSRSRSNKRSKETVKSILEVDIENQGDSTSISPRPVEESQSDFLSSSRPRFGILQAVQAKMAESGSSFSQTIVKGPEYSNISRSATLTRIMSSTADESGKSRSRPRSTSRGRAPKVVVTKASEDRVPMLELGSNVTEVGESNLAYEDTSEV